LAPEPENRICTADAFRAPGSEASRRRRRRGYNAYPCNGASGINGNGYGALLAFKRDGTLIGPFNDDSRIVDPRGLVVDQKKADTSCGTLGA
jgi:hypothetical protein